MRKADVYAWKWKCLSTLCTLWTDKLFTFRQCFKPYMFIGKMKWSLNNSCSCFHCIFISELSLVAIRLKVPLLHLFHKELHWNLKDRMLQENCDWCCQSYFSLCIRYFWNLYPSVSMYIRKSTMKHNAAPNQIVVFVKVDETFTTIWLSRSSEVRVKVTWDLNVQKWRFSNSISSAIFFNRSKNSNGFWY